MSDLLASLTQRLTADAPRDFTPDDLEACLERLLAGASAALATPSRVYMLSPREKIAAETAVLALAALTARAVGFVDAWCMSPSRLFAQADRQTPILATCAELGAILSEASAFGKLDLTELETRAELAREFAVASQPHQLRTLLHHREPLRSRLAAYVGWRDRADAKVQVHAEQVWRDAGWNPADMKMLLAKTSIARLRTYSDNDLKTLAQSFNDWDPIIRYLAHLPPDPGLAKEFETLRQELVVQVKKGWPNDYGGLDAEDAVHEALAKLTSSSADPLHGYCYEGALPGWLATTAINILRQALRQELSNLSRGPVEPDILSSSTSDPSDISIWMEWLRQQRHCYLLAASYFDDEAPVKEIYREMIEENRGAADGEAVRAAALAKRITEKTGRTLAPGTVYTIRRRLRQRLGALFYVLECVPAGAQDQPGDASLLAFITARWGLAPNDVATVRGLGALARANGGDRGLADALAARWLVGKGVLNAADRVAQMADLAKRAGCSLASQERCADAWLRQDAHKKALNQVSPKLRGVRLEFLLAPCWLLVALRNDPIACFADRLNLALEEWLPIKDTVALLGSPGGLAHG